MCGDIWIWENGKGNATWVVYFGDAALQGLGGRWYRSSLYVYAFAAGYKAHYEDDERNEEKDFSQVCCAACETAKAEYGCDQGYDEKGDGPS